MNIKKSTIVSVIKYGIMLLTAFIFVFYASATTSPFIDFKRIDSYMFLIMGRGWKEGLIPYIDLFDQKGPAIFFINMLGFWLTGNKYGVFLLQILFMFASEILIYFMLRRVYSDKTSLLMASLGIFAFLWNYENGNMNEEYANPFIIASFLCLTKWLDEKDNDKIDHSPWYAFVYGITFGFCLMSRVTNAIGVCLAILLILIYLIYNKRFINIFHNAVAFILGALCIVTPFAVYFAVKGATYDFWYGTILFNLHYATQGKTGLVMLLKSAIGQIGSYALMAIGLMHIARKKYFDGVLFSSIGIVTELLMLNIKNYKHYYMIIFPYLPVAFYELKKIMDDKDISINKAGNVIRKLALVVLIGLSLITVARTGKEVLEINKLYDEYPSSIEAQQYAQEISFTSQIPEEERTSVLCYGLMPGVYFDLNIDPPCKYFVLQEWMGKFTNDFAGKVVDEVEDKKPEYIVCNYSEGMIIEKIINESYREIANENIVRDKNEGKLVLYKRNH